MWVGAAIATVCGAVVVYGTLTMLAWISHPVEW